MRGPLGLGCLVIWLLAASWPVDLWADALAKLKPKKLAAVQDAVASLRTGWQRLDRAGPLKDVRANLHVHSHWSHDSRGTLKEIVSAAHKVNTQVLLFTEHPADHYDFFQQGHQGLHEGVLLIPGAEMQGFLAYPTMSLRGLNTGSPQEFSDLVRGRGGQMFVSHLEERMDWVVPGVSGVEVYNTHADFKDEKALIAALRNPLWMFQVAESIREFPQESYSALQDYPADYLRRWDQLCATAPHTGVAANDAHQNVGLVLKWSEPEKVRVEDALGKLLIEVERTALPGYAEMCKDKHVGDTLFRFLLDPYEISLRHVGTHLLIEQLNEAAVREALDRGRAFVAFDWLADSTGFDFAAMIGSQRFEMGSEIPWSRELTLRAQTPLAGYWRLIRNGEVVQETAGRTPSWVITEPGNYRAEVWLEVAGERMIWILSNPVYIRPD